MSNYSRAWVGWIFFAASLMLLVGLFQVLMGVVALFDEAYFLVAKDELLIPVKFTVWGWTHIGLGVVAIVAGFGVMLAQLWARVIAIFLAILSIFSALAFYAATPLWNLSIIMFNIIVIFALVVHGDEVEDAAFDV
jgi:hypothetical protein